ncbi:hypothetical protein QD357_01865 [Rhizobium sp. BR 317]|uniref:hypothetical protein n=1 Tax=Rhizobium sp. BR 317 TaxID=3040015 RepID=UPI0039BFABB6
MSDDPLINLSAAIDPFPARPESSTINRATPLAGTSARLSSFWSNLGSILRWSAKVEEIVMSSFSLSRRQLLASTGAFAGSAVLRPIRVFAQGWEEVPLVLSIISSIVGIVSGIAGLVSSAEMVKQLKDIQMALEEVIQLEFEILKQIASLKLYIDQAILNGWAQSYGRDITAYWTEYSALANAPDQTNEVIKARWVNLAQSAPQTTVRIGEVDFGVFPFFAHGIAISIVSFKMINFPLLSQREYYSRFAAQIERWLDPKNPRSLPASVNNLGTQINTRISTLNTAPRKVLTSTQKEGDHHCRRDVLTYTNISGDFAIGFSGSQSVERGDWVCLENPGKKMPWGTGVVEKAIAAVLGGAEIAADADKIPTIPVFTPSGLAPVDERNKERIAILELAAARGVQKAWGAKMDELRKVLRAV